MGYRATAIDLTGSGVHSFDPNSITDLSQYVQPLTDFLEKLPDGEKVFLISVLLTQFTYKYVHVYICILYALVCMRMFMGVENILKVLNLLEPDWWSTSWA